MRACAARVVCRVLGCTLLVAADAGAQALPGRVALEAIASASSTADTVNDPFVILDLVGTVRLADGWDVVVRPWARRMPGADWSFEMYQLQVRYVSSTRIPFRVDAGIITSPLGLSTLELQPHRNPLISAPFYYFTPLPKSDGQFDHLKLLSGGYPLGAVFSVSGTRWDARAGVTDHTPARSRSVFGGQDPGGGPHVVLGGGVTPVTGLRFGAGVATGTYESGTLPLTGSRSRRTTVFNLEGEYAVGHTRLSGEWVRTAFDTPLGVGVARGFNVQATRTLSPQLFAATRITRASSPVATFPLEIRRSSSAFETVLGYRVTPELTIRGGYRRERGFRDTEPEHAAILSLVLAERWW